MGEFVLDLINAMQHKVNAAVKYEVKTSFDLFPTSFFS